ncbi:MAG: lipoyl(octanoyl) transferase LipB [Solirubrobacterales bacterium]|nr:lipoyl(octanoyl) transferase LipB [Solirubrobacterales bacterium]
MDEVWCVNVGQVPYEPARELQKRLETARHAGDVPDLLLLLEHPPTYTRGRRSEPSELPMGVEWYEMQGIEVRDTDRGGRVTYHGPGQLVGYPIMSLRPYGDDVHEYLRRMERVMIGSLGARGIEAGTIDGLTGVWAGDPAALAAGSDAESAAPQILNGEVRKIGSIGVHVSRGITTHGFAINVSNDLQPFEWIVPCGIDGCRMTSVSRELGSEQPLDEFAEIVVERFGEAYERRPVAVEPAALDSAAPAIALSQ